MRKNIPQLIFGACSMDCKAQEGSVAVVRGWAFLDVHRWHLACWHGMHPVHGQTGKDNGTPRRGRREIWMIARYHGYHCTGYHLI